MLNHATKVILVYYNKADMSFREFFGSYADQYSKSESHKYGNDLSIFIKKLEISKQNIVIDLACGTGNTAVEMARLAEKVVCLDGTPEMLEKAKSYAENENLHNIQFVLSDIEKVPFGEGEFDVVTCRRAAHHFSNKAKFLENSVRILKTGGKFGLVDMVPPEGFETEYNDLERIRDPSHVFALGPKEWIQLIESNGIEVKTVEIIEDQTTFSKWLYPVEESSENGMKCKEFLLKSSEAFRKSIKYDGELFLKRRMILLGIKK